MHHTNGGMKNWNVENKKATDQNLSVNGGVTVNMLGEAKKQLRIVSKGNLH